MSGLFSFLFRQARTNHTETVMIAFCGLNVFDARDLTKAVTEGTNNSLAPDRLFIFLPLKQFPTVQQTLTHDHTAFDPLPFGGTSINLLGYDHLGNIKSGHPIRGNLEIPAIETLKTIRRCGMTHLFRSRDGVLEAGPTAHFIKPSKQPDRRFLRASHALSEGPEVYFVAFWILPHIQPNIRCIHIDTSTIGSVAYAAIALQGEDGNAPTVRTFRSYGGMNTHGFVNGTDELVLISASQSGTMAETIAKKMGGQERIVTLFALSANTSSSHILCDLSYHAEINPNGYPTLPRMTDAEARSSRPMRIVSEQFVIEPTRPIPVVIGKNHAPLKTLEELAELAGFEIFSCRRSGYSGETKSIWADAAKLITLDVCQKWAAHLARKMPISTKAILYLSNDDGSLATAKFMQAELKRQSLGQAADIPLISDEDIRKDAAPWGNEAVSILIVSGAIGRGHRLLSVSRDLRTWSPNSQRFYISLMALPPTAQSLRLLHSNLKMPDHVFERFVDLCLPREAGGDSWEREVDLLQWLCDYLEAPDPFEIRLKALNGVAAGLSNNLFWDSPNGPLSIRNNFAFWPENCRHKPCTDMAQADVYVTMAAIMENARSGEVRGGAEKLTSDVYRHAVLSPEVFSRYNDGIIQAAILRAAQPLELDYRDASDLSEIMSELILRAIEYYNRPQGEAALEFLFCIATGRMKLADNHTKNLMSKLIELGIPEVNPVGWMAKRMSAIMDRDW